MKILALEASTSSGKAMLYDAETGKTAVRSVPYPAGAADVGTQDADAVCSLLLGIGRELCAEEAGAHRGEIAAVALGSTWHSVMTVGARGEPTSRLYLWNYTPAAAEADLRRRDESFVSEFYQRTGCYVHSTYPALLYMHNRRTGVFRSGDGVSCQGGYLFRKLTGESLITDSLASGHGFVNTRTRGYDSVVLDACGLTEAQMEPLGTFRDVRPLTSEAAGVLGVRPGIPVVPPNADGALNQVGAGALRRGVMTVSLGTSGAMRLSTGGPVLPQSRGTWCYLSPNGWLSGAATNGCMSCVDWFVKTLAGGGLSYRDLDALAAVREDNIPVFLPFLFGERCPGWRDTRPAGFYDLRAGHDLGSLYRAVLEGVVYNLYQCFQILTDVAGRPEKISLSGGILKVPFWAQMLTDIFNFPMVTLPTDQASLLGGAILGLCAVGALTGPETYDPHDGETLTPNWEKSCLYAERFGRYLDRYREVP